ncbi:MAG TPA: tyrosine-type recombinase/integrase [Thermoanaerobaculaceae bacterium]|nr:tyrosine-type recombinase/integrase [Thermoanaerobaculaceae bacterium]
MAKTQGQLEERSPGHWRLRVFAGRDKTGKRHYVSATVEGTKRDAERALRSLLETKDRGKLAQPARRPLAHFLAEWLEVAVRPRVRAKTLDFYRAQVAKALPDLGALQMNRLGAMEVQRWVNGLVDEGLSPRSVRAAFSTLHSALRQAVRWRLLSADPSEAVELPRNRPARQVRIMTPEQAAAFLEAARGERFEAFFVLAVATGCRPGELAALRWEDCDLVRGTVSVHRALAKLAGGELQFTEPKTARGRRVIPLPGEALAVLKVHRRRQLEARLASGGAWQDSGLVFVTEWGTPLDLPNLRHRDLRRIALRARMPHEHFRECRTCSAASWLAGGTLCDKGRELRKVAAAEASALTLYSLRHTAASVLLAGGVHAKAVSERMGHASTAFTMETYVHSLPTAQDEAADTLGRLVFGRGAV